MTLYYATTELAIEAAFISMVRTQTEWPIDPVKLKNLVDCVRDHLSRVAPSEPTELPRQQMQEHRAGPVPDVSAVAVPPKRYVQRADDCREWEPRPAAPSIETELSLVRNECEVLRDAARALVDHLDKCGCPSTPAYETALWHVKNPRAYLPERASPSKPAADVVERVARALHRCADNPVTKWEDYKRDARFAIEAMSEVSEPKPSAHDGQSMTGSYAVGALVQRRGSDYKFPGTVVSVFRKLSGEIRYVVEDDRGTLFIQSDKSLEIREP